MAEIRAGRCTAFFVVPAIYQAISLHGDFATTDFSRVRSWGCGGAPLPATQIKLFAGRGVKVCNGMGMTETGPTVFLMDAAPAEAKNGRSEEHTSELQSLMRISSAVFCLEKKNTTTKNNISTIH